MNNDRSIYQTYCSLLNLYVEGKLQHSKIKQSNSLLSKMEKDLLSARVEISNRNFEKAKDFLSFNSPNKFFSAEKNFLLATIGSLQSFHEKAIVLNLQARELYSEIKDRRGLFLTNYNISVDYGKLSHHKLSEYYLNFAKSCAKEVAEKNLIIRAELILLETKVDNKILLKENLSQFVKNIEASVQLDQCTALIIASELFLKIGCFDESEAILLTLVNKIKGAYLDRARFNLVCLNILRNQKVTFPKLQTKEFNLKLRMLRSIMEGNTVIIASTWEKLKNLYPNQFLLFPNLEKKFEHGVFFILSFEYLIKSNQKIVVFIPQNLRKKDHLIALLKQSKKGLEKSVIIRSLWHLNVDQDTEPYLPRFYKLVERARKDNRNIRYADGVYSFDH